MLAQLSAEPLAIACAVLLVGASACLMTQWMRLEVHIRKIGATRAPSVAGNPLTASIWFFSAAKAQTRNRLLDFFNGLYDAATPECPNCVGVSAMPWGRYLLTRDPEHIKVVLTTQFSDFGKGRRGGLIRPMFVKDRISDLETFEKGASAFLSKLPSSGKTVDIMDLLYRMTLDVTTDFLLGASVDSLDNPRNEFAGAFSDVQRIQMMLTTVGPFKLFVPQGRYNRGIQAIDRFIMPYIEQAMALPQDELEKLSNSDKHFTFLYSIARYTRNRRALRDQIIAVLLAGRDTTAATLSWAFYELSHFPDKYKKLRDEVLAFVGRTRTPTYEDIKEMAYMRYTLNETLRLYPAVPYNLRAALEDTTLPSTPGQPPLFVAKGDMVIYSVLAMQRRKDLYPPTSETFEDPAVFSPERWENWRPKPWQYVPFNGGPRICVGQNFAMTEMAYCMVRILQKYDRLEYRGDWHAQLHEAEIVGKPSQGVKVALYEECS
ncbi:cytochrome P450 monooxygenase CYP539B5 [Durotheca rogersii]|uniref:cytochrome P450 monooxygenase CYP539B5 n=1 Tax=Durotheca rogersii TaxID=419775 RepID=UPI00221F1EF1|nr:cytochrome P450 monooxygenase CYP539B5 [Durotheca rogersii]KAI5868288.1 cytochrome P450 monooxygenase CYP539B5 [Durotheca rogersii]